MMICKADFQDLFPETFPADPEADAKPAARPPNRPGLARWEDEGGRLAPASASDPVGRLRSPQGDGLWSDPRTLAPQGSAASSYAAFGAYWAILAKSGFAWRG